MAGLFRGDRRFAFLFLDHGRRPRQDNRPSAGLFDFFLRRFAETMRGDVELLGELAIAEYFELIEAALGEILGHQGSGRDLVAGGEMLLERGDVDRGDANRPLVVEAALGHLDDRRRSAALEDRGIGGAGPRFLAFVAAARRLALARANAPAEPLGGAVLADSTMYVTEIHDSVTPRRRSTSCFGRNWASAANVALTSETGLFEPKLLVRMSWMPADSQTARTAVPAITPVPGEAGTSTT